MVFVPGSIANKVKTTAPATSGFVPGSIANKIKTTATKTTSGFVPGSIANKTKTTAPSVKADLTTSEGLYDVAQETGGAVAQRAGEIKGVTEPSTLSKVGTGLKKGLGKVLDVAQRANYATASAVKNVIDKDAETTFVGGLKSGITGKTKNTYSDVFTEAGWKPTSWQGKASKGITSFALDVLLDPTTYITFGAGAGAKVGLKVAGKDVVKRLSKEGMELLSKGTAQKAGQEFGESFVRNSIARMAEGSPELYKKFIDQGGIKFFDQTLISGGRIAGISKMIPGMSKADELSKPVRNTLYALFNKNASVKYGALEKLGQIGEKGATGLEYVQFINKMEDFGKVAGPEGIQRAVDIAKANNLTSREADFITNAIENGLPLADDRLDNARKLMQLELKKDSVAELKKGIERGELPNYVPHMTVKEGVGKFGTTKGGLVTNPGFSKERTIEGTIDEINQTFGEGFFDTNIVRTVAMRNLASARAIADKDFITGVAENFGARVGKAPTGYIASEVKGLEGLVFHPAIAESINNFKKTLTGDEATNKLLEAFDKVQNLWKASVTSIFPAFHGRNAISNVFQNFLDIGASAINPAKHALSAGLLNDNRVVANLERTILKGGDAAKAAKGQLDTLLNKPVLTDTFGKKWTFGEVRKEMKDRRVAFGDEFTGALDVREEVEDALKGALKGGKKVKDVVKGALPISQDFFGFKAGRKVGNAIEQQARILNFMTNLERTGDVVTAAERTKQFLFDYTNLSTFEKNVMKRLIPFYTFTRKNLELQATQLAKQPGKLATQAKIFTNISKGISGETLSEEETKLLPDFLQQGLGIVSSRDGNKLEIISSAGTPIEGVFSSLQPNAILGSLSPVIAVPLQVAIGKSFFFDTDLADTNAITANATSFKNAPQFIKDYIGFTVRKNKDGSDRYIALNPTRLFILNNIPPSSRVIATIAQLEDENVSGKLKILRQLTGIKPYGADLDKQEIYQERAKIKELQNLLDSSGVAPIFKKSFIPKTNP